jgi:dihydrolipoamide dehydrogenase
LENYQVVVIGGGPGGYESAIRLSQYGIGVAVVEKERLGGVCLNWGCIPTKTLVKSAELVREIQESESYGLPAVDFTPDYKAIWERKNTIVESLVGGIEYLYRKRKIPVYNSAVTRICKTSGAYELQMADGNSVSAQNIILATGSTSKSLPGITIDEVNVLSSTGILKLDTLPKSLAVVGGGVIGCEFASIYATLGVQVTIIEFLPRLIALEDEEISKRLAIAFKKSGIKVMLNVGVKSIQSTDGKQILKLSDDNELEAEKVLLSVGREPVFDIQTEGFELIRQRGAMVIDSYMRTNVPDIYAIGDLTAKLQLAHTASKQGLLAVEHIKIQITGEAKPLHPLSYTDIPRCTFTNPEIASVGYTEAQAKEVFGEITVGKFPFSASGKALAMSSTQGFVKTIARKDKGELVGMHIMGPQAAELIAQGAIMIAKKMKAEDIHDIVFAHPTLSEAIMESVEDLLDLSIHKI